MKFGSFGQSTQDCKYDFLHFWDKTDNNKTLVIATHGFLKKVNKVPTKEIDRAIRLKDKYFERKQKSNHNGNKRK